MRILNFLIIAAGCVLCFGCGNSEHTPESAAPAASPMTVPVPDSARHPMPVVKPDTSTQAPMPVEMPDSGVVPK
jgi:hypothetical protein